MATIETIPAIYVKLENRPGTLERVGRILAERRVNIDAISLETAGGAGFARILARNPREVVETLRREHVEAYESELVVAGLPNRPGEIARAAGELAAARINVESVLTTPEGRLAFRTSDNDAAARILGKL